jgi:Phosphotransferase enzyme family
VVKTPSHEPRGCATQRLKHEPRGCATQRLQDEPHRRIERRGETVWRPLHPWSPAVHDLLLYLESVDFPAPRLLDVVDGFEVVSFIAGDSGSDGWAPLVPESGLRAFARLLRDYHVAVAGFTTDKPFYTGTPPAGTEVVCHGDFGPWNTVFRNGEPVGLIDFDYAKPASAWFDIAYALQYVTPFRDDEDAIRWLRYPEPPDRLRRMETFIEAYGVDAIDGPTDFVSLTKSVIDVQYDILASDARLAAEGLEPQATWVANGHLEKQHSRIAWSEAFAAEHGLTR